MQISNILFTVLAAGASFVAADDATSGTSTSTINLTKTATLTSIPHATSHVTSAAVHVASSSSSSSIVPNTTSSTATFFPAGNGTLGVASGTGVVHLNSTAKATGLTTSASATATSDDSSSSSTASASATSSSSAAAGGMQAVNGGLLLGALGAAAMLF